MMGSKSTPALPSARSTASRVSTRSRMSEARRERLRDIQRRAMLQDELKDKLFKSYGSKFAAESDAKRVIAEEVGRVVQSPVISHIDIENMQANVQRRSLLTGRKRRMSRSRATARRAAGSQVIGTAKFTPRVTRGHKDTPMASARGGRRVSTRSAYNGGARLGVDGQVRRGGASQPQTDSGAGQARADEFMEDVAARVEREKWKHTSATAYGAFAGDKLEILPAKPRRIGQEDRATVEWNLLTEFEIDAHEAEEAAKARAEKQAKVETVEFLHRQAAAKEEARKREREQQLAWDRQKMEELEALEKAEAEKAAARRKKELADRKEYEKSLSVAIEAKRKAQELEKMADEAYALNAARAVAAQKKEEEDKIRKEKERFKLFIQANEMEQAKKEAKKKKEAEEDYKRMVAYMEVMDKQQKAREAYFREFQEKTKRKFELDLDTTSRGKALEQWVNKRVKEAEAKAEEERKRAAATAAAAKKKATDNQLKVLAEQIAEKEKVRARLREESKQEVLEIERKIREAKRAEEVKKQKQRQKNEAYRRELEAQIRGNAQQLPDPYFHMTDTERMYNYDKLTKAKQTYSARMSQRSSRRGSSRR